MNEGYDAWAKDAPRWQAELERKLAEHGGQTS